LLEYHSLGICGLHIHDDSTVTKEKTPAEILNSMPNEENVPFGRILLGRPSAFLLAPVKAVLTGPARKHLLRSNGLTLKLSLAKNWPKKLTSVDPLLHLS